MPAEHGQLAHRLGVPDADGVAPQTPTDVGVTAAGNPLAVLAISYSPDGAPVALAVFAKDSHQLLRLPGKTLRGRDLGWVQRVKRPRRRRCELKRAPRPRGSRLPTDF